MAYYKNKDFLSHNKGTAFDKIRNIGESVSYSGIYHCIDCGYEITMISGNTLPPENSDHKNDDHEIQWQLIVANQ